MSRICAGAAWAVLLVMSLAARGAEAAAAVPLIEAVKAANVSTVRTLLQQKVDVNATTSDGATALHWAVFKDDANVVDMLIKAGANPKTANRYGATPLQMACVNGNAAIIERLLTAGVDVNSTSAAGETALMTAARTGKVDAVAVLLRRGANVNARESANGQTALMWAAGRNNAEVVKTLIEAGADFKLEAKGNQAVPPMGIALERGTSTLDYGSGAKFKAPKAPVFTAFDYAVRQGHVAAVKVMLDAGYPVNRELADGSTALLRALINNHFELAAVLIDRGADVRANKAGWTALHQVAVNRRPNVIGNGTPWASPTGTVSSLDVMRKLVAKGADPNARMTNDLITGSRTQFSRLGATPILLSAKTCDLPAMRLLVELGADPKAKSDNDDTALMLAAGIKIWAPGEDPGTEEECFEAAKYAIEQGNDINAFNSNGDMAVHGAALRGNIPLMDYLISKGAKIDKSIANDDGWTPLSIAIGVFYSNHVETQPELAEHLKKVMAGMGITDLKSYEPDLTNYDCGVYCSTRTPEQQKVQREKRAAREARARAERAASVKKGN